MAHGQARASSCVAVSGLCAVQKVGAADMSGRSAFQIFAEYGGRQHALAERRKRHRGHADAFPEMAGNEDPIGDERYTTSETINWCRRRAGVEAFDLDVAACEESHWANLWYTKRDNGLARPWFGDVWCNPPYSDIAPWVEKTWAEWGRARRGDLRELLNSVSMLIPASRTEQKWWQTLIEPFRDGHDWGEGRPLMAANAPPIELTSHFLPGRTSFARPGSGGLGQSGAPFGCVLLIWRRHD